jgi:hypothetical protein
VRKLRNYIIIIIIIIVFIVTTTTIVNIIFIVMTILREELVKNIYAHIDILPPSEVIV